MLEVVVNIHVQVTVDMEYVALRYMLRTKWTAMNTKADTKSNIVNKIP